MQTPYADAAHRHFADALLLQEEERLPNADQLFGLAAECALKAALHGLGLLTLTPSGMPEHRPYQAHVEEFWTMATALLADRVGGRWLSHLGQDTPFQDWSISQRYARADQVVGHTLLEEHARAAARALRLLDEAVLDGVVA